MLKLLGTRVLGTRERDAVLRALDADPVAGCMIAARVQQRGIGRSALGGELWTRGGAERALCFSGGNLVPLAGTRHDIEAFADRALRGPRLCTSLVGRSELTMPMWTLLESRWGPAREVRPDQPLLALDAEPAVKPDALVRRVTMDDLAPYLEAAIAMFIEEVGIDPRLHDGGQGYRERVAATIRAGRAWARIADGRVLFKAEVGSYSDRVGQIQGVWVRPGERARGLGTRGTATLCAELRAAGRTPSLYVNSFNAPARASYARIGFRQVATFSTVLID
ncbi:GNAT family N-acetyltransferase [Tomitella fengzijianii]|uniref:GNAT family N-acetyltransferase n=1 Tax=Tomitella fengzijianii TaxID=2597660 RepID=A0A516X4U5_9ACTN|nr:GNAT family N-acetyltransferase [Tomitella fengzijianii]QDQ97681.1 GNAT family N-acetyltransferase [Tomitella fengzijianii]